MAARRLYHYSFSLTKDNSGSDSRQIPAASVTVKPLKLGATANGAGNDNAGAGATITVDDPGHIVAGDTIYISELGGTSRTVDSITGTTIVTQAGGTGTFAWTDGQRIITDSSAPTIYTDDQAAGTTASISTDADGEADCYLKHSIIDVSYLDSTTYSASYGLEGELGTEEEIPEDWGAARDGSTNDATAFENAISYIDLKSGGKLKLGAGTYRFSATVDIDNVANLVIEGAGRDLTTLEFASGAAPGIQFGGTNSDIHIRDLELNRQGGSGDIVEVTGTMSRLTFSNVKFTSGGTSTIGIDDQGSTDLRLSNCHFSGTGWTSFIKLVDTTRALLENVTCLYGDNVTDAINIDEACADITLDSVIVRPSGAVSSAGGRALHIQDNAATTAPSNVKCVNCTFVGGSSTGAAAAVTIADCLGISFNACSVIDSEIGYDINGGTGIEISGGLILGINTHGIDIESGASQIFIGNGIISSDVGLTANDTYNHIDVAANTTDVHVHGMVYAKVRGSTPEPTSVVSIGAGTGDQITIYGVVGDATSIQGNPIANSATGQAIDISHNTDGIGNSVTFSHTAPMAATGAVSNNLIGVLIVTTDLTPSVKNVHTIYANPTGGSITISDFEDHTDGQFITITNLHASNTVTINDGGNFANNSATNHTIGQYDSVSYRYSATAGLWIQQSTFQNNT